MRSFLAILFTSVFLIDIACVQAQAYGGYTLYSKMGNTKTYLLDAANNIYHQWTTSPATGYDCYLLPGQVLLRTATYQGNQLNGAAMCGRIQKIDWSGNIIWDYIYSSSSYCTHHDICPLPNGNVLLISYDVKTSTQASAAGCASGMTIWSEKVIEVQPTGSNTANIVWEWKVWDHLVQNNNSSKPNYGQPIDYPGRFNINFSTQKDWFHMNGIDYNPQLDQIVLSSHNWSEIFVIDHSTTTAEAATGSGGSSGKGGDILYRWGNPQSYGAGTAANKILKVVHDAHWIPEGCPNAGYIVAFNNQGGTGSGSCIDMINPPLSGYNYTHVPGTAYGPSTYTYRHSCLQNSSNQSNSEVLPNGNLMVCIAQSGYMYEVNSSNSIVWSATKGGTICQAHRYSEAYVLGSMSATCTALPSSVCEGNSTQLNVNVSGGSNLSYSWSSNPAGFISTVQNPSVNPLITTIYTVTVYGSDDTATSSVTVTVNPIPDTPSVTLNGTVLTSSAASGNQWYLNNVLISGAVGQTYTPLENGSYTVQVINNNCTSAISAPYIYTGVGIDETNYLTGFRVFPIPVSGMLHIEGNISSDYECDVSIVNSAGLIVFSAKSIDNIDVSQFNNGMYLLKIVCSGSRILNTKFIIQH